MDNKHKGNLAVASAIHHFVSAGYVVSIPLADTAKYDLVVERHGVCQRVLSTPDMRGTQVFSRRLSMCPVGTEVLATAGSGTSREISISCTSCAPMAGHTLFLSQR